MQCFNVFNPTLIFRSLSFFHLSFFLERLFALPLIGHCSLPLLDDHRVGGLCHLFLMWTFDHPAERLVLRLRHCQVAKRDLSIILSGFPLFCTELAESPVEPVVSDVVAELFSSESRLVMIGHDQFRVQMGDF